MATAIKMTIWVVLAALSVIGSVSIIIMTMMEKEHERRAFNCGARWGASQFKPIYVPTTGCMLLTEKGLVPEEFMLHGD